MLADDAFDRAAAQIADGEAVDWLVLEGKASTSEERERTASLQIVDAVARWHRALPPDPAQEAGRMWGRYRLTQVVGSGSYGSVYRAFDPELEREVAIKILHRQFGDSKLRERLLREGRALAKVRHPHVVSVIGVESYGDRVGLCMEFVHGETLDEVLRMHGTMNAREATLVGQDVCRALSAVHAAGYVHRDVKAGNIMRDRTGRIVLMDFGAGREIDEAGSTGPANVVGTPPYMSPEVLSGEPATPVSDVYSVGVLLYYLVTKKYPVEGSTTAEIKAAHLLAQRTPISNRRTDLPPAFVQIVDRATAVNPKVRWPSAGALLESLSATIGENSARRSWASLATPMLVSAVAAFSVVMFLGWITSYFYNNLVVGRAAFVSEGPQAWLYWGVFAIGSTIALSVFGAMVVTILLVVRRLVLSVSGIARRLDAGLSSLASRLRLNDVSILSNWALIVSATVLAFSWWSRLPFIEQLLAIYPDTISTAPSAKLAFLSAANRDAHVNYRLWFVWSTIICGAVWIPVWRLAIRTPNRIGWSVLIGGFLVFLISLAMAAFPYRLLVKSDMETAQLRGEACYVAGQRGDDVLVFCPSREPPRSEVVPATSPDLQRLGVLEDILTRIQSIQ